MMEASMPAHDFFLVLGALLEGRRAAFKRRLTIAFAVVDEGPFFVDTQAGKIVSAGWRDDAQVSVLCNRQTLSDLLAGRFDPAAPEADHLFVWGGDKETLGALAGALGGGMTAFGAHLAALKK